MAAPRPEAEPLISLLIFICAGCLLGWGVWWLLHPQFLEALRYLRLAELGAIGLFTDRNAACFDWLRIAPVGQSVPTVEVARLANACFGADKLNQLPPDHALDYYNLSGYSIAAIGRRIAYYTRWIFAFGAILVAPYIIYISPRNKFKTRHTLESFIKTQVKMWPVIAPIVDFVPAKYSARAPGDMVPDKIPPFAEAFSSEEWIAWHSIPVTNGIPDREAVRRAFLLQLGPRWQGLAGQPPYIRALFAAFALKGGQKREQSDEMLGRISQHWSLKKGLVLPPELSAEIEKLLADQALTAPALKIAEGYAYRTTALLGVLKWARWMGGVLAPGQFLWLRAVDRSLWYPFDNLGRRTFHAEGAGAMAHFMAEQNAKKALPIPRVDTAIVALNQYLATGGQTIPPREAPQKRS